jgi:hypothetical protein
MRVRVVMTLDTAKRRKLRREEGHRRRLYAINKNNVKFSFSD